MSRSKRGSGPKRPGDHLGALYPTLDLHGLTASEAVSTARAWLRRNQAAGESTVRLVTGRGLHSSGPPVLPGAIDDLLAELGGAVVRAYEREPGGGAYRIRLAEAPSTTGSGGSRRPRHDPELLRQADEALADLGVTPTDALIEAEIRRIVKERADEAK
ncbi:MAG TPA: Smr/MutS family protein [Longimicrobiaceae bacterium]|nr:Smr/MutS family protein [Longimicrobiaceae bacterium]